MIESIGNVRFMQKINRVKVLTYVRKNSPVLRNELAQVTGLSLSSITNIVNYLLEAKLVSETGRLPAKGAGRKAIQLEFCAEAMRVIAINIDSSAAEIAVTDLSGGVIVSESVAFDSGLSADEILSIIEKKVSDALSMHSNIRAIGVAVSGYVAEDGRVNSSIMRWIRVDVKERFEKKFGISVYVANNTRTKALWTMRALNNEVCKNTVFLDMSEGVGIISFYNGEINDAVAGELGHTIIASDGPQCFCGNRGCLETVCSANYIAARYSERAGEEKAFREICALAEQGDASAEEILREAGEHLGMCFANIMMIFEPDMIIINTSELTEIPRIYDAAVKRAESHSQSLLMKKPCFRKVRVDSYQAAQGAAQYVADNILGIDAPDDVL